MNKIRKRLASVPPKVWLWLGIVVLLVVLGFTAKCTYDNNIEEATESGVQTERAATDKAALETRIVQGEQVAKVEVEAVKTREVIRYIKEKGEDNVQIIYRDVPDSCGIDAAGVQSIRDTYSDLTAAAPSLGNDPLPAATPTSGS